MSLNACWLLLTLSLGGGEAKDYPRKELLIEAAELAKILEPPQTPNGLLIIDARPREQFEKGHILHARWVNHDEWSKAFAKNQDPREWAKRFGDLGLDESHKVVLYDDAMQKDAARIWWILRYFGHKNAKLLNGGWKSWTKAKLPVSTKSPEPLKSLYKIETPRADRLATAEDVLKLVKERKTQIIDTRSEAEYCGDEKLKNKNGGAIPGAMHLEWSDAIDKKTQKFKGPEHLREIFKNAGIDLSKPSVTHCQSGGRAAVMAFTLELMGAENVANYYRGWSEWGNREDTPIVTPKK